MLTLKIAYQDTTQDTATVTIANLASPLLKAAPAPSINVAQANWNVNVLGQDGVYPGQVQVTPPTGTTFSHEYSQAKWTLNDQASYVWSTDSSLTRDNNGHQEGLGLSFTYDANQDVTRIDLYFRPIRDEVLPPGAPSTQTNMTLRADLPSGTKLYQSFAGRRPGDPAPNNVPWDMSKLGPVPRSDGSHYAYLVSGAALLDVLQNHPEVETIQLAPGYEFQVDQPLRITHSVKIQGGKDAGGNLSHIKFASSSKWDWSIPGMIYVGAPYDHDIQVILDTFQIEFNFMAPIRWNTKADPNGNWDPIFSGDEHAVIATMNQNESPLGNDGQNRVYLQVTNLVVQQPPPFAPPLNQMPSQPSAGTTYVGEPAIPIVRTGIWDSGVISGNQFQGGQLGLQGGPWIVSGNDFQGTFANSATQSYSYSPAAVGIDHAHDVELWGNHVHQVLTDGRIYRLVNFAGSVGFNNSVQGNVVDQGAGLLAADVTHKTDSGGHYDGVNDPEVILTESGVFGFEGMPGAISPDGMVLTLNQLRTLAKPNAGDVVAIVTAASPYAGRWRRIAQRIDDYHYLMDSPLPVGDYAITIAPGFVNHSYLNNTLDLTGAASAGLVLDGSYGATVKGNHIIGGDRFIQPYAMGLAFQIKAGGNLDTNIPGVAYPVQANVTRQPSFDVVIDGNLFENSPGGGQLLVSHDNGNRPSYGRVYLTASVTRNVFQWSSQFWNNWVNTVYPAIDNPANGAQHQPPPGNNPNPPTVTIGSGFNARADYRKPWGMKDAGSYGYGFVDPNEAVVSLQGNTAFKGGTAWTTSSGQIYAGVYNQTTSSPIGPGYLTGGQQPTLDWAGSFSFNLANLDATPPPSGVNAVMVGQDGADHTGAGGGPPNPDGIQDLHFVLTGLDPSTPIAGDASHPGLEVIGVGNESWQYGGSSTAPQAVVIRPPGSTTADVYIGGTTTFHLSDTFQVNLRYQNGNTVSGITLKAVRYDPGRLMNSSNSLATIVGTSLGQDNSDYARVSNAVGSDGFQDLHLRLSNLFTSGFVDKATGTIVTKTIDQIDVFDAQNPARHYQFHEPGSPTYAGYDQSLPAVALGHPDLAPTADLYIQYDRSASNAIFYVQVIYHDGTASWLAIRGVNNVPSKPVVAGISLDQDGNDLATPTTHVGQDKLQDLHFRLTSLPSTQIYRIDVTDNASTPRRYVFPEPPSTDAAFDPSVWSIAVADSGLNQPTADLYLQYDKSATNATFGITVTYADGSQSVISISGVDNNPSLKMAGATKTVSGYSLGQDGSDNAKKATATGADGLRDLHFVLKNLPHIDRGNQRHRQRQPGADLCLSQHRWE